MRVAMSPPRWVVPRRPRLRRVLPSACSPPRQSRAAGPGMTPPPQRRRESGAGLQATAGARRQSDPAPAPARGPSDPARRMHVSRSRPRYPMLAEASGPPAARMAACQASASAQARLRWSIPRARSRQLLATQRAGAIEAVHRPLDTSFQGELDSVGDTVDYVRKALGLSFCEPAQHVVAAGLRTLTRGLADANSKTHEIGRAQRADHRENTVVPGSRSSLPDSHSAERQIQLVVHQPQLLSGEAKVAQRFRHGLAGQVHVCLRQDDPHTLRLRVPDERLPALAVDLHANSPRQLVQAGEAQVVARVGVFRLGVAQANDKQLFSNQLLTLKSL